MVSATRTLIGRSVARVPSGARAGAREQVLVTAGQLSSGVGNLVFTLVMARLLEPAAFTQLAVFLALYLLLHIPLNSISAHGALVPQGADRVRRRVRRLSFGVAGALLVASPLLAQVLQLPLVPLLGLAASAPIAGLLALERGRLYGSGRHLQAVASLTTEPAVRLTAGVALGMAAGTTGAVVAVVAAGYVALAVARRGHSAIEDAAPGGAARKTGWTIAVFGLLAVAQNLDLLLANRILDTAEAAHFAALSTLGGAAAFATATIPVVLLPRAANRDRHALTTALGAAALLGAGITGFVVLTATQLVELLFGARYAEIAPLAGFYVLAMALLGLARVLLANLCAAGRARTAAILIGTTVALHLGLIVMLAGTAAQVASTTLASSALLLTGAAGATVIRMPVARPDFASFVRRPWVRWVGVATLVGLVLRLLVTRGIWLDEATSIYQVQLGFGEMIESLRVADVHPPLHYVVLWGAARLFGTSELAMRLPSIIAGTALIPAGYWLARELYEERVARIAAGLLAVAPFVVWYSQEARMYAFFMLFSVLAVIGQVRALKGGRALDWILFALASSALVWTQYMGVLQIGAQQVAFLGVFWSRRHDPEIRRLVAGWLAASLAIAAALAALAPFAIHQYTVNEQAGKGFSQVPSQAGTAVSGSTEISVYAAIANVIWALWGYHADSAMAQIASLWPLGLLFALLMLGRGRSSRTGLLLSVVALPLAALLAIGLFKRNLFEVRYVAGIVPLLLVLAARLITTWVRPRVGQVLAVGALTLTMLVGLADQQLNGANPRLYDFEGALGEITRRADDNDVVVYEPVVLKHLVDYYAPGVEAKAVAGGLPSTKDDRRVFLVGSFLDKANSAAATRKAVSTLKRKATLVEQFDRPNVKVWIFE